MWTEEGRKFDRYNVYEVERRARTRERKGELPFVVHCFTSHKVVFSPAFLILKAIIPLPSGAENFGGL